MLNYCQVRMLSIKDSSVFSRFSVFAWTAENDSNYQRVGADSIRFILFSTDKNGNLWTGPVSADRKTNLITQYIIPRREQSDRFRATAVTVTW